ncbi:ribonuclease catalytic domain-containing protein [Eikenella corrodens]|uniref:ribonuclease catalytic domain-containing protein n=1 Tax=Eikenella corrodens TaxID=539 RepID=UPI0006663C7F|nr:RNB domain-containing ribonuclease [Eikenella corrodens]
MNIFYEESGQFKVAAVVQKNDSTYQATTQHGKRAKIKANNVFVEFTEPMDAFLERAQAEAAQIDTDLLWEFCGEDEFTAQNIAADYFGHTPSQHELAATLIALYAAPMYFYKKGKGVFKAAPEDTLKQALAAIERKKQQDAQIAAWAEELAQGRLPAEIAADLRTILHNPDKQSLTYKAFTKAAAELKISAYQLARQTGGVNSLPQYLLDGFCCKHFPQGTAALEIAVPAIPELPDAADLLTFSIDDAETSEIDDALSVQDLPNGGKRVGIHIAVPTLAIAENSPIETLIKQRQSTAYYPGGKITMLPDNWIQTFSLDEGKRPVLSLYVEVDADFQVASTPQTRLENLTIKHNLRIQDIEPHFNADTGLSKNEPVQFPCQPQLRWLYRFAVERQKQRDRYEENRAPQYDYGIEFNPDGSVRISRRERGSPIDTLVSEMMILANSTWAQMLDENDLPGLFRVQTSGKVRMSTQSEPHIGMGVAHYGWFTSPLRRAADCINQLQLLSLIDSKLSPRFQKNDSNLFAALRDFDATYTAYADFQRQMEAYWSLIYLEQEQCRELTAVLLKEDLVRIDGLPLVNRVHGIPIDIQPKTRMKLAITQLDAEQQLLSLKYLNALPPESAA